ncbi:hypothetical protein AAVH_13731, partial [Aphelenchoides avenae]
RPGLIRFYDMPKPDATMDDLLYDTTTVVFAEKQFTTISGRSCAQWSTWCRSTTATEPPSLLNRIPKE